MDRSEFYVEQSSETWPKIPTNVMWSIQTFWTSKKLHNYFCGFSHIVHRTQHHYSCKSINSDWPKKSKECLHLRWTYDERFFLVKVVDERSKLRFEDVQQQQQSFRDHLCVVHSQGLLESVDYSFLFVLLLWAVLQLELRLRKH